MNYHFEAPPFLPKLESKYPFIRGYCPLPDDMWLYTKDVTTMSIYLLNELLEHEHLHAIFHRFGIPLRYHHLLTSKIDSIRFTEFAEKVMQEITS